MSRRARSATAGEKRRNGSSVDHPEINCLSMKYLTAIRSQQSVPRQWLSAQHDRDLVSASRMLRADHDRFPQQLGRTLGRKLRSRNGTRGEVPDALALSRRRRRGISLDIRCRGEPSNRKTRVEPIGHAVRGPPEQVASTTEPPPPLTENSAWSRSLGYHHDQSSGGRRERRGEKHVLEPDPLRGFRLGQHSLEDPVALSSRKPATSQKPVQIIRHVHPFSTAMPRPWLIFSWELGHGMSAEPRPCTPTTSEPPEPSSARLRTRRRPSRKCISLVRSCCLERPNALQASCCVWHKTYLDS
jgi:hypothetical protein